MRIVWSPLAIERAYEAAKYIARDKPEAARSWLEGVFERDQPVDNRANTACNRANTACNRYSTANTAA